MESQMMLSRSKGLGILSLAFSFGLSFASVSHSQEKPSKQPEEEAAQIELRKTPFKARQYQGKMVEGEERVIKRGDSLWRILVREKGLSERRFGRYLVIVGSLNPKLKNPDILQVGDTIFIPIRPDEILGIQVPTGKGEAKLYRVKQGEYLYKILREQFALKENKEIHRAYGQVKELNPGKKNWNLLFIGEAIFIPGPVGAPSIVPVAPGKPMDVVGLDYARKLPARENLKLLEDVMAALGNETRRGGEEVVPLKEGNVRIDRESYPVIQDPKKEQKVILDIDETIPPSIRKKIEGRGPSTPVVPVKKGASLYDAVSNILSRLGFQSLPTNRPVVVHEGGVDLQVKGEWMVASPEEAGGRQEVLIISLTDLPGKTPDYLRDYLSLKGMNLKEILLPSPPFSPPPMPVAARGQPTGSQIEAWPRDKNALVDAFLGSYQVSFSRGHELSVPVQKGINLDTKLDRLFEYGGKKIAFLFRPVEDEVRKALQEKEGIRAIELDLNSLSSREVISRLLEAVGDKTAYREHRFSATEGGARDRVVLAVSGFYVPDRSMFLTDREIPKDLQRFFFEKGLRVVRFQ